MKILIVSDNRHSIIGGVETYNRKLIEICLKANIEIFEFPLNKVYDAVDIHTPIEGVTNLNKIEEIKKLNFFEYIKNKIKSKKKLLKIIDNYDLIIDSTNFIKWPKYIYKKTNWLYVQHMSIDYFKCKTMATKFLSPLIYFFMWLFGFKNPVTHFKNFVCFSKDDIETFKKKEDNKYFWINLTKYSQKEIEKNLQQFKNSNLLKERKDFVYFGRLENHQKRVNFIQKQSNKFKINVSYYGKGKKGIIKTNEFNSYKGFINEKDILKTISPYKWNILLSKAEGFPFSIVESMSVGVPTISTLSSTSIRKLIENKGFLVNKKTNLKLINEISDEEYKKMVLNCFDYALKNLTNETFDKKWLDIIYLFKTNNI